MSLIDTILHVIKIMVSIFVIYFKRRVIFAVATGNVLEMCCFPRKSILKSVVSQTFFLKTVRSFPQKMFLNFNFNVSMNSVRRRSGSKHATTPATDRSSIKATYSKAPC